MLIVSISYSLELNSGKLFELDLGLIAERGNEIEAAVESQHTAN